MKLWEKNISQYNNEMPNLATTTQTQSAALLPTLNRIGYVISQDILLAPPTVLL